MKLTRIPKRFFDDHFERGLPTPRVVKSTSMHYWIDVTDPSVPDLLDDADFYRTEMTNGYAFGTGLGLQRSAEATYQAIQNGLK